MEYKTNIEDLILLNMIGGLGYRRLQALLAVFKDISAIRRAKKSDLIKVSGISMELAGRIVGFKEASLSEEMRLIRENGAKVISIFDEEYPENLKHIYSPPIVLYVRGKLLQEDADAVAIVGSRLPSHYGVSTCESLAEELASRGITIVSGLARGIDTAAHRGAIKGGRTIAVLGSGLNYIYPPENRELTKNIQDRGAVVSEFPMKTLPFRANFPKRNRLISGLSLGVVVVEASRKSGSLITAHLALEENRELFAVPGQVRTRTSAGSNNLIKEGAKLVECADDVIEEIESRLKFAGGIRRLPRRRGAEDKSTATLDREEERLKRFLSHQPMYIDELAKRCKMTSEKVSTLLLNMELKKVVKELPGKNFVLLES